MDLNFVVEPRSPSSISAGYSCPCGCRPVVTYERDAKPSADACCCGNSFAVGAAAERHLQHTPGFETQVERFESPWGESLSAVWSIGPSVHAEEPDLGHQADHGLTDREGLAGASPVSPLTGPAGAIDPVCGMAVEPESARAKGLNSRYEGRDFFFCGKGCKLEFEEDPGRYLDASYIPSM